MWVVQVGAVVVGIGDNDTTVAVEVRLVFPVQMHHDVLVDGWLA
jgi:hypothetical protein